MSRVQFKTNHGDFVIELNEELAPISSANFLEYVKSGHYNGTIFHRVISNFMIQGGGMEVGMKQKETRENIEGFSSQLPNISMCPSQSRSFVGKNGDDLCCDGNPAGTSCEGKIICTLSSTSGKDHPSCAEYLEEYYRKKGREVCIRSLPNYYEDVNGKGFCTNSRLNLELNGPTNKNADKCSVGDRNMTNPESCDVKRALERMPCPSRNCKKIALEEGRGLPVIFQATFRDSSNITRSCYDTNSVQNFWHTIFGEEWKSKTSHINPDRNIIFCEVAKKYYVDKSIDKSQVDL